MTAATWISLYGAGLSSALALLQFITWRRARPRIKINLDFLFDQHPDGNHPKGTPITIQRGSDKLRENALVHFTVRNFGDKGIQISAIVIESLSDQNVNIHEIIPDPLPSIVEPLTSLDVTIQKEFIDMVDQVSFVGIVDALGRRHAASVEDCLRVVRQSWELPTRVQWFRRREDPQAEPVTAFQALDKARLSTRPIAKSRFRKTKPFICRSKVDPPAATQKKN